jgi:hypothetical protein
MLSFWDTFFPAKATLGCVVFPVGSYKTFTKKLNNLGPNSILSELLPASVAILSHHLSFHCTCSLFAALFASNRRKHRRTRPFTGRCSARVNSNTACCIWLNFFWSLQRWFWLFFGRPLSPICRNNLSLNCFGVNVIYMDQFKILITSWSIQGAMTLVQQT